MIVRRVAALLFVPLMLAFGSGVYFYLGTLKSKAATEKAKLPTQVAKPKFVLPGTMFVVQAGRIFKLSNGLFTEIGPAGDWSQPTLTPDHSAMVVVNRGGVSSDLWLLDTNGVVIKRLTKNETRFIGNDHWAFYPHITPDGGSVVFSYDSDTGPGVDFSIWTMPINGSQSQARRRTDPYWYTGGDVSPIPLPGNALLYVKHTIDTETGSHSQIWYQSRPFAVGKALTDANNNCGQPSLSPDGTQLLMICSPNKQTTTLEVAPFSGGNLGPARVLLDRSLYAQPTWSPDGKAIVYYAPGDAAGHFELWWLAVPPPPTPPPAAVATATASAKATGSPSSKASPKATATPRPTPTPTPTPAPTPIEVTQGVDLSATSPPAWY